MLVKGAEKTLHLGLIMDGNGRWATDKNQSRVLGHRAGADTLDEVINWVVHHSEITHLTIFGFAIANQSRVEYERSALQQLFQQQVQTMLPKLVEYSVKTKVVGDRNDDFLSSKTKQLIRILEKATATCDGLTLVIAWNYSGENEIKRAEAAGVSALSLFTTMFDAPEVPPIDVVVRTGVDGAVGINWRDSDFFPLLSANAVKVPMIVLWPDIVPEMHLAYALSVWEQESHLQGGQRPEQIKCIE